MILFNIQKINHLRMLKLYGDKKGGGLRAIKKLKPNTTYYIRYSITTDVSTLKAYKKNGGIWSKTIKVKTKK